ncbi:MAG: peptidylprolyl isomerase [Planctomycetota bacterium]|jgi:peptidyl-prolyl cis-trans isomerase C
MEDKLDFSLPEKKQKSSFANKITIILLLILTGLGLANLLITLSPGDSIPQAQAYGLSAEQIKQLAAKLSQRNLYHQAAKTWQDYLAGAELTDAERAKVLFQIGMALEKANLYGEAIEYFYRSEVTAKLDELTQEINTHTKSCFEKLGKLSALRYELMDRTSVDISEEASSKVVAEIGAEKITQADLDTLIEETISNQLSPMASFMTAEQFNEQKKKMLGQYQSPQAKQQFLQTWLAKEILYRQALEEQFSEKPEVKRLLDELARGVLSQQLINEQLASKINITETDLQTYYTANKDKYIEPAKATISHILVNDEIQAKELIKRVKEGEDFGKLAKEHSQDDDTKDNEGKIELDVTEGSFVPIIGDAYELNEKIFAAEAPTVLDEPFQTEKGWEIIKVDSKQVGRQKSFDEVRQQVMMELTNRKSQDVQQDYIKQMMDKYDVIIHTSVLMPSAETEPEADTSGLQK